MDRRRAGRCRRALSPFLPSIIERSGVLMSARLVALLVVATTTALATPSPGRDVFRDVLDTPAASSALAARSLINGLARAGGRLVAVGQRGHVLVSDDEGRSWSHSQL